MGAPSPKQIDEAIADGVARGENEAVIAEHLETLERLDDDELAAFGVYEREDRTTPGKSPAALVQPTTGLADDFIPAPTRNRIKGWTAQRQRLFLETLAITGCVSEACGAVNLSARSAYSFRHKPGAESFAAAWVHAESLAATRLTALAFDRAVHGKSEYLFKDGVMIAERRTPSDRLLMWLIAHLDPVGFGRLANRAVPAASHDPRLYAAKRLPQLLDDLADMSDADCPTEWAGGEVVAENEPHAPA